MGEVAYTPLDTSNNINPLLQTTLNNVTFQDVINSGEPIFINHAMEYGGDDTERVYQIPEGYTLIIKNIHHKVKFTKVGALTDMNYNYLARATQIGVGAYQFYNIIGWGFLNSTDDSYTISPFKLIFNEKDWVSFTNYTPDDLNFVSNVIIEGLLIRKEIYAKYLNLSSF